MWIQYFPQDREMKIRCRIAMQPSEFHRPNLLTLLAIFIGRRFTYGLERPWTVVLNFNKPPPRNVSICLSQCVSLATIVTLIRLSIYSQIQCPKLIRDNDQQFIYPLLPISTFPNENSQTRLIWKNLIVVME